MGQKFQDIAAKASRDPQGFWREAAKDVAWIEEPQNILDDSNPPFYNWFPDGLINGCYNAVDRHVDAGRGDDCAIIYDSPITDTKRHITFAQLQDEVSRCAGMIAAHGVGYGDRVIIYMPMVPSAVIGMLACARIGAIHSVVFGGFAAAELAKRIDDARPKLILTASCGIEPSRVVAYKPLLDEAIEIAEHKPDAVILEQRPMAVAQMIAGRDFDWAEQIAHAAPADCVAVRSGDPAYILYTSGTTGMPKGVVRPTGAHIVALKWSMKHIYDCKAGDVYWAASDVGWVVGHSYITYAPLFEGCTTIIYEGKPIGTPDAGAFFRVISEHKVRAMFTAPTAIRAVKKEDPDGLLIKDYDLSHFKYQFLAGERCDPDTLAWCEEKLGVPTIDHWWQTETGWSIAANCMGIEALPVKAGSPTLPIPTCDVQILDEGGKAVPAGEIGSIVVKLPLPPGSLSGLWQNDERFIEAYMADFPDIINVAGHRLSTGGMEEVLSAHGDVAECAVLGVDDDLKGQVPMGFVVLKSGVSRAGDEIIKELVADVREKIGPVAAFKLAVIVARLPKTRSGKILRGTIQKIANGTDFAMPATIDDPVILDEITDALRHIGYPKS